MPTMLTTESLLNSVLAGIQDNSNEIRAKMLAYLNKVFQRIAIERDWKCLQTSVSNQTLTTSAIALPSNFVKLLSVYQTNGFYFDKNDELTSRDVYDLSGETGTPVGYRIVNNILTLYPSTTGDCDIEYIKEVPVYTDSTTSTVYPIQFQPLIERACMDYYYEYDMDERVVASIQLDVMELSRLKKYESSKDAVPRYNNKGYLK